MGHSGSDESAEEFPPPQPSRVTPGQGGLKVLDLCAAVFPVGGRSIQLFRILTDLGKPLLTISHVFPARNEGRAS